MSGPGDAKDADGPQARHAEHMEKPNGFATKKPTREERLAKALRDNLKRRKASAKKEQA